MQECVIKAFLVPVCFSNQAEDFAVKVPSPERLPSSGDVDAAYLNRIESARGDMNKKQKPANASTQMDLNLIDSELV